MNGLGAYRLDNGAPVTDEAALAIWRAVTREVLEEIPSPRTVTREELARQVQQRSGVYTRTPASQWLPAVLVDLDDSGLTARIRSDPPPAAVRTRTTTPRRPRAEPAPRKREAPPPAICPTCFMQLPASGRCDTCG